MFRIIALMFCIFSQNSQAFVRTNFSFGMHRYFPKSQVASFTATEKMLNLKSGFALAKLELDAGCFFSFATPQNVISDTKNLAEIALIGSDVSLVFPLQQVLMSIDWQHAFFSQFKWTKDQIDDQRITIRGPFDRLSFALYYTILPISRVFAQFNASSMRMVSPGASLIDVQSYGLAAGVQIQMP